MAQYKRILLKLSGESLMGGKQYGIDEVRLNEYATQNTEIAEMGVQPGNEIGGGSVRIFQDAIQEKMLHALGFTDEQAYSQFGFLLDAFKYGVPPHAGLAYGLDRLVMLMAKQDSIRDVIAFPKVKDASCLMTQSPSRVSEEQLKELELEVRPEEVTE